MRKTGATVMATTRDPFDTTPDARAWFGRLGVALVVVIGLIAATVVLYLQIRSRSF